MVNYIKGSTCIFGGFSIKTATCNECHGGLKGDFCKFFLFFKSSPRIDSSGF